MTPSNQAIAVRPKPAELIQEATDAHRRVRLIVERTRKMMKVGPPTKAPERTETPGTFTAEFTFRMSGIFQADEPALCSLMRDLYLQLPWIHKPWVTVATSTIEESHLIATFTWDFDESRGAEPAVAA